MKIPVTTDLIQASEGDLEIPEIRVWCHPHKIKKSGDDYYKAFDTFAGALEFIKKHKESESSPLIAFRGYEINLFAIKGKKRKKNL